MILKANGRARNEKKKNIHINSNIGTRFNREKGICRIQAEYALLGLKPNEWEIITPFDVCPEPDKPYSYYMGKDIEALLECDAIYLCEGWQNSKGCMAEFEVARIYGKEIIFEK